MPSVTSTMLATLAASACLSAPAVAEHSADSINEFMDQLQKQQADLDKQQAVLDALQSQLHQMVPDATADVAPRSSSNRRRRMVVDDTSEYHGVRVESDEAIIALGATADVQFVRTGPDAADIVVDDLSIHGNVYADNLFSGTFDVSADCCNDPTPTVVTLEALTGFGSQSPTEDRVMVDFKVAGSWTSRYIFANRADSSELLSQTYRLEETPTHVRFTVDGSDGWGIARGSLSVDGGDPVVFVCTQNYGEDPEELDSGHFVDEEREGGSENFLTFAIEPACTALVTITSTTGDHDAADANDLIMVKFMVDGEWTEETILFVSTTEGQTQSSVHELASDPTKIAFTDAGTDMWGFDSLSVDVNGVNYDLTCAGSHDYPQEDSVNWVGGSSSTAATKELIHDVVDAGCQDYIDVVFTATTGTLSDSQTANDILVSFQVDGVWSTQFLLAYSTSQEAVESDTFALPGAPTDFRVETSGTDAYGVAFIDVNVDGTDYSVLCGATSLIIPPQGDNGYWVKTGSFGPIEMAIQDNCDVTVDLEVITGSLSNSQTSDPVYVAWNVGGTFTEGQYLFGSTSQEESETETFIMSEAPTEVKFIAQGTDAWGWDYLSVTIDGTLNVLSCAGEQTSAGSDTEHWVDANGDTPSELAVPIVDKECI